MKINTHYFRIIGEMLLGITLGLLVFLYVYGRYPLYFSNVYWLYNQEGDSILHQIGWEWFRQEPWQFPIGHISDYGYPFGTSIYFTDSIPLLAIPFKLFSPLLSTHFQYLGLWELISICGQIIIGLFILKEFTPSIIKRTVGSLLLTFSPPLFMRSFGHASLTAHWIILTAIWLVILEFKGKSKSWAWIPLFAIVTLVHPYFLPMIAPFWIINCYFQTKKEKNLKKLVIQNLSIGIVMLLLLFSLGVFSIGFNQLKESGYDYFSWNLNDFINPFGNSTFLKGLPLGTSGQYEGYSYLGLGVISILPIAMITYFQKDFKRRHLSFLIPVAIAAIILGIFSLSNKVYFGDHLLWEIPLSQETLHFLSIFRASGRFIWPAFYLIILFVIISIIRNYRFSSVIILLALIIQIIDLQPQIAKKKFTSFMDYHPKLQAEFWQDVAASNEHIVILPTTDPWKGYEPVALFAKENQMTLNWGYFARSNSSQMEEYAEGIWQDLTIGSADNQTIYFFWDSNISNQANDLLSDKMFLCTVDGYPIAFSADNQLTNTNSQLSDYCSIPVGLTKE